MNLVITHNQIAFEKFMKPYVFGTPYEVLLLQDGYLKIFKRLLLTFFDSKNYTIYSQHPLTLIFFIFFVFKSKYKWIHFVTGQVWVSKIGFKSFLLETLDRLLLYFPDYKVCDSRGQYQYLLNRWKCKPIVHFTGIGSMGGILEPNQISCLSVDQFRISWIGRDTPDKDLKTLLRAFDLININEKKLFIYGVDGEDTHNIHYLGFVEDIQESMLKNKIDVNVVTSIREGFCMSILESASIGIPTISTKIYGTNEIIEFIGMSKFCFQVTDEVGLYKSLCKFNKLLFKERMYLRDVSLSVNNAYSRKNVLGKFKELIG